MNTATPTRKAPRVIDPALVCYNPLAVPGFSALDRIDAFVRLTYTPDANCQEVIPVAEAASLLDEVASSDHAAGPIAAATALALRSHPSRVVARDVLADDFLDLLAVV